MRVDHSIVLYSRWVGVVLHTRGDYPNFKRIPWSQKLNPLRYEVKVFRRKKSTIRLGSHRYWRD